MIDIATKVFFFFGIAFALVSVCLSIETHSVLNQSEELVYSPSVCCVTDLPPLVAMLVAMLYR